MKIKRAYTYFQDMRNMKTLTEYRKQILTGIAWGLILIPVAILLTLIFAP